MAVNVITPCAEVEVAATIANKGPAMTPKYFVFVPGIKNSSPAEQMALMLVGDIQRGRMTWTP